jgi:hypothetical protein
MFTEQKKIILKIASMFCNVTPIHPKHLPLSRGLPVFNESFSAMFPFIERNVSFSLLHY